MPQIEVRPARRVNPQSAWLEQHRSVVTSQCGQDGIFQKILEIIGIENRWCVEFGAWDGKYLSNTWNLIENQGWSGVLIEGSKERYQQLLSNHAGHNVTTLNVYVGAEGINTLDNLLATTGAPKDLDVMSIDIDGNDWHVWNSLKNYRPRVVCIEFNPNIPNEIYFVQDADPSVSQGASLLALIELGKKKGYELVGTASWDGIFVRSEDFSKFGIVDNSIDAMLSQEGQLTYLFQGFDGTLWTAGVQTLVWKGISFQADELQLIPKAMRTR